MTGEDLFDGRIFDAFLFDMDGTLISSIEAAEHVWTQWARRHGLDVAAFLPTIHGKRSIDTIREQNLPGIDVEAENDALTRAEIDYLEGIHPIAGVGDFLRALPSDRWALVTSASLPLALSRLGAAGVEPPAVLVTADDVTNGKPAPDGYLLAARKLGFAVENCVVFEDAPAGIAAGENAGAQVLVIRATHPHPLDTPHPAVDDYRTLAVVLEPGGALRLRRTG